MKFNLVVEIDDEYITGNKGNPDLAIEEVLMGINNTLYRGLSCIDAMLNRDLEIDCTESYVKNQNNKPWGELWGDNFPTDDQCPIDVLDHHAKANNVIASDDVLNFGRAMWNEGNLTEKLS